MSANAPTGKGPTRSCVACRTRRTQAALVRFRRRSDGVVVPVFSGRVVGRSAYLCPRRSCFEQATRRRAVDRALSRAGRRSGAVSKVYCPAAGELWEGALEALDREIEVLQRTGAASCSRRWYALVTMRDELRGPGRSA